MSLPRAESRHAGKVAVLGAQTDVGGDVRRALEAAGVRGDRIVLYGSSSGEALLSEYAGEARMIQEPDVAELAEVEVVFVCDDDTGTRSAVRELGPDVFVLDLLGCLPTPGPRVHPALNGELVGDASGGRFTVPHAMTMVLAELLHALDAGPGVAEATAVILRPAADFGQRGVEELREQTVRLLSFTELPVETFGRQLAFNILPHESSAGPLDEAIAGEVTELLGWSEPRLSVCLLTAPMFYGHAIQVHFRPNQSVDVARVRECVKAAGMMPDDRPAGPVTPLDVTAERRTDATDPIADGRGGFWLWVVAGDAAAKRAEHAVELATRSGAFG